MPSRVTRSVSISPGTGSPGSQINTSVPGNVDAWSPDRSSCSGTGLGPGWRLLRPGLSPCHALSSPGVYEPDSSSVSVESRVCASLTTGFPADPVTTTATCQAPRCARNEFGRQNSHSAPLTALVLPDSSGQTQRQRVSERSGLITDLQAASTRLCCSPHGGLF